MALINADRVLEAISTLQSTKPIDGEAWEALAELRGCVCDMAAKASTLSAADHPPLVGVKHCPECGVVRGLCHRKGCLTGRGSDTTDNEDE